MMEKIRYEFISILCRPQITEITLEHNGSQWESNSGITLPTHKGVLTVHPTCFDQISRVVPEKIVIVRIPDDQIDSWSGVQIQFGCEPIFHLLGEGKEILTQLTI